MWVGTDTFIYCVYPDYINNFTHLMEIFNEFPHTHQGSHTADGGGGGGGEFQWAVDKLGEWKLPFQQNLGQVLK